MKEENDFSFNFTVSPFQIRLCHKYIFCMHLVLYFIEVISNTHYMLGLQQGFLTFHF